jgi:hypothetical protein
MTDANYQVGLARDVFNAATLGWRGSCNRR